ncbi:MAG TPA: hypothetical protein VJJ52_01150 [Candidatus Nanoarchaeia archaeon]|nr:hypothetical protein [Candidatus Nanoarchaeia archaeon]
MDYSVLIGEVVRTYELPARLESRIITIANKRVHELHLNTVAHVYNYVDYLVERFNPRREDKVTFSLDTSKRNDARTLQEKIGIEDPNLAIYTQRAYQHQEPSNPASSAEVLDILRGNLSELDFNILLQIMNMGVNVFTSPPEELLLSKEAVISQIPQIQERVEILTRRYERDGRIVIPARPIVYVRFNPELYIKFGRRRYNGNPIAVYEANREVYDGMSRGKLSYFDKGLYGALLKSGQIDIAIPKPTRIPRPIRIPRLSSLPQSEVDGILNTMASRFTYIHLVDDERFGRFGLVGRVLNWNSIYIGQNAQKNERVSEPKFVIIKPRGIKPIGKPQTFPFRDDDELHLLAENWYPYGSIQRWSKGPHIANAFRKIDDFQDGERRKIKVQFYEIPEGCLGKFPDKQNQNEELKVPNSLIEHS